MLRAFNGLLLTVTILAGCARGPVFQEQPAPSSPNYLHIPSRFERTSKVLYSIDEWLGYMTVEEKVGQLLWIALEGTSVSPEAETLLKGAKVGGFVFFAGQGSDPETLRNLTDQLQSYSDRRDRQTPGLFIAIDGEGGRVQRLNEPFTSWPGAMAIGATGSEALAYQVARAMARELLAVGINMNLAPVADVNNNPWNPVIGVRSFGEDPDLVSRMVKATVRGFQTEGISAVAKHFPGHGDTTVDSHLALPTVTHPLERLRKVEFEPFRAAISAGADAVMTAHILYPALDPAGLPATLSSDTLTGFLRRDLSHRGLILTDAMDGMKAITDNFGLERSLVLAVQAGADGLMVTESFGIREDLHRVLVQAVEGGQISRQWLDDAVRRILTLKHRHGLIQGGPAPVLRPALGEVGRSENLKLAHRVGSAALTVVKNRDLPLRPSKEQRFLVIGPSYGAQVGGTEGVLTALGAGIKNYHGRVQEIVLDQRPSAGSVKAAREAAAGADVIVYGVMNGHWYADHQGLIRDFLATGKPVVVVGMGEPYELLKLPEIGTYIAAYGYRASNLYGIGALIFGHTAPTGRLPVAIPGLYSAGYGHVRSALR